MYLPMMKKALIGGRRQISLSLDIIRSSVPQLCIMPQGQNLFYWRNRIFFTPFGRILAPDEIISAPPPSVTKNGICP